MIYEQRTYQVHAGKAADFLKTYEECAPRQLT
jgi:hypothetical protein